MGIEVDRARLNMSHLVDWKDKIVKQLTGGIAQLMRANKVTSISAFAAFSSYDPQSGIKTLSLSNGESVQAKNVIVATGSESVNLPFLPVDGKYVCSSKEALDLREIPERIIVVGGGFIGLELGTFFMKVGAELSVVEASPLLLPGTDRECVSVVEKKLKKQGAQIFTNTKALGYKKKDSMVFLDVERENGEKESKAEEENNNEEEASGQAR